MSRLRIPKCRKGESKVDLPDYLSDYLPDYLWLCNMGQERATRVELTGIYHVNNVLQVTIYRTHGSFYCVKHSTCAFTCGAC